MKLSSFTVLVIALILPSLYAGSEDFNTGSPFGPIDDTGIERLAQFSKTKGLDVVAELQKAYSKDEEALARVFGFSIFFDSLDPNARAYGQIVYSSMLNLGEAWGVDKFSDVLARQDSKVQQRIRDFLFYDVTQAPKDQRMQIDAQVRSEYPTLFPPDYVFGCDDPVFSDSGKKRREEASKTVSPLIESK
jgi:hypothetical protein